MSSGQPSSSSSAAAYGEYRPAHPRPIHSRGPPRFARKPSFAIKREEIKREFLHDSEGEGTRAPVRDEDVDLLLGLASPVNGKYHIHMCLFALTWFVRAASPTLPSAPSRLSISSLVNPHDVPVSTHASPLSAPPHTTAFGSPPVHHIRARSVSPALDVPPLPILDTSRATTVSMSISVEPEPIPEPVPASPVATSSGSKLRLPRIPKKNGYSSTSSPGKSSSTSSPGKNSSTSSPSKALGSPNKSSSSPGKSSPTKTSSSPGKPTLPASPTKSNSSLTTRQLLTSKTSSPLKPRGRVSKGPKKRRGPGWIIESCTTSDGELDRNREFSPSDEAIAAKLERIFGGESDLSDLSSDEEEEEEEYDPGLAGLPALPISSESEYEPRDGESASRRRRRKLEYAGASTWTNVSNAGTNWCDFWLISLISERVLVTSDLSDDPTTLVPPRLDTCSRAGWTDDLRMDADRSTRTLIPLPSLAHLSFSACPCRLQRVRLLPFRQPRLASSTPWTHFGAPVDYQPSIVPC
ncbi:hypothetical protein RhiLY_00057 [Ceratobasidium sp. AG-Ba]|nr:hypothetical protein RhiLY_00057 [Ceratobasidium sp. AG-Ba]